MIQYQLKLKLTKAQEVQLISWLPHLTSIWNWAIRKIELDAKDKIYYSKRTFQNLLSGHSDKLGIPSHTINGILIQAYISWQRCFKKISRKPKFKGNRNKLNSILFPDSIKSPVYNKIRIPLLGLVKFHKQELPEGKIKNGCIIKRASGWYLCLNINAQPNAVPHVSDNQIGIDPGYSALLTLSTGEKIEHPKELQNNLKRLGQAQRGNNTRLTARLNERIANQKKDRNHKISHELVSKNQIIAISKDNLNGLSRTGFGKSVGAAAHGQLRSMLSYKSRAGGREYIEVPSRYSTKTCSNCGCLSGPTGRAGLKVRQWECIECGTLHDRDINAAVNTLIAGLGTSHESHREVTSGIREVA